MKRSVAEQATARPRYLKLQCPECTHAVRVARDELMEGAAIHCRSCGAESELTLAFDAETGRQQWLLLDPLVDFDDEDERH
jgi:transcription elongation factor Elf1